MERRRGEEGGRKREGEREGTEGGRGETGLVLLGGEVHQRVDVAGRVQDAVDDTGLYIYI